MNLRISTVYTQPSFVECWLFESKYNSHQSSQSFRIDFHFLKKLIFICLGPSAGPDGLIPWTRFCKVGAVWSLCSECFPLSVEGLGFLALVLAALCLLWRVPLAHGTPRASCLLSFSALKVSLQARVWQEAPAWVITFSHIRHESSVCSRWPLAWQRFSPVHE